MDNSTGHRLRFHWLWLVLGYCLVAAVIYFSLDTRHVPEMTQVINDKVAHFLTYAVLALWFMQLYTVLHHRITVVLALISMGISLEILQALGGVRMFELADMAVNILGALTGWLLASTFAGRCLYQLEMRYFNKVA